MNWDAIGAVGEVVGALGVIATLAYLALQIRQNSRTVKAAATQAVLDNVNTVLQAMATAPQGGRISRLGQVDIEQLDPDERMQFILWAQGFLRVMDQAYLLFLDGQIEDDVWQGYANHLESIVQAESVRNYWQVRKKIFSVRFRDYVDGLLAQDGTSELGSILDAMTPP